MQATKQRISTHKRTRNQGCVGTTERPYCPKSKEGLGMYVFVGMVNGRKVSITKHCNESDAEHFMGIFD